MHTVQARKKLQTSNCLTASFDFSLLGLCVRQSVSSKSAPQQRKFWIAARWEQCLEQKHNGGFLAWLLVHIQDFPSQVLCWWETCLLFTTVSGFDFEFLKKRMKRNEWTEARRVVLWDTPGGSRDILPHGLQSNSRALALPPKQHCMLCQLCFLPYHTRQELPWHAMEGVLLGHSPYVTPCRPQLRASHLWGLLVNCKGRTIIQALVKHQLLFSYCVIIFCIFFLETEAEWNSSGTFCLKKEQGFINHVTTC